jgi:AraC family transcriptional regulator
VETTNLSLGQYFGAISVRKTAGSVVLTCVEHRVPRAIPNHAHQAGFLSMLLWGDYREVAACREYEYSPFCSVFHPAGLEHRDRIGRAGASFFNVEFTADLFEDLDSVGSCRLSIRDLSGAQQTWATLHLLERFRGETSNDLDLESQAINLLFESVRATDRLPTHNKCLRWAKEYIQSYYRESLTVAQVAGAADVHPVYLSYLFRKESGHTLGEYLNRVRVRAAAVLLTSSRVPISAIAAECGFSDQSHLTRVFKNVTGITPGLFRIQLTQMNRVTNMSVVHN